MIKIICDSMSDLPKGFAQKYDIHIVPTSIIIDEKEYLDGIDITTDDFFKILRNSKEIPKTSQATYSRFLEAFKKYANKYSDIIYIGSSSKASGTYQSGVMAINDIKNNFNCNFHHIDTLNFSAGGTLFVIKACLLLKEGKTAKDIVKILENLKGKQKVFLTVDDLNYLKKGGRISSAKATLGTMLNLKPIMELKEGIITSKGQCRGKKQVASELFNRATKHIHDFSDKIIVYGCGDNIKDLPLLKDKVVTTKCKHVYEIIIGPTTTSHTGPEMLGIAVL